MDEPFNGDMEPGMIQTFEDVEKELIELEIEIITSIHMRSNNFRATLNSMWKVGKLEETELVQRWRETLSIYNDWVKWNQKHGRVFD